MRTIVSFTAICAALGFLLTLLPDSVGQYEVGNQQQAMEDAFQQQLDDAIERGDIVKQIQPDGRVMYINAALVKTP